MQAEQTIHRFQTLNNPLVKSWIWSLQHVERPFQTILRTPIYNICNECLLFYLNIFLYDILKFKSEIRNEQKCIAYPVSLWYFTDFTVCITTNISSTPIPNSKIIMLFPNTLNGSPNIWQTPFMDTTLKPHESSPQIASHTLCSTVLNTLKLATRCRTTNKQP